MIYHGTPWIYDWTAFGALFRYTGSSTTTTTPTKRVRAIILHSERGVHAIILAPAKRVHAKIHKQENATKKTPSRGGCHAKILQGKEGACLHFPQEGRCMLSCDSITKRVHAILFHNKEGACYPFPHHQRGCMLRYSTTRRMLSCFSTTKRLLTR